MSKKPRKVGEPKATYAAKKPAKTVAELETAAAKEAEFRRITGKLFTERKELLRKLAQ